MAQKIKNEKSYAQNFLASLAINDNDFNGNNGLEFLWEEARGYNSNFDYLEDYLSDIEDAETYIREFIERWIGADDYYEEYSLRIEKEGDFLYVSICWVAR
jgi:hypothetical protein